MGSRRERKRELMYGMAAGAAGTTVLNALTYLDMAVRGRPASTTPEDTVRRIEETAHITLDGRDAQSERAGNRRTGIGALLGIVTGVGAGAVLGLLRPRLSRTPFMLMGLAVGATANAGTVAPMVALGVTDPRRWPGSSWAMDVVPHVAYGLATVAVFDAIHRRRQRRLGRLVRK